MKEKIKSVGFWVSVISALILLIEACGVEIGDSTASAVTDGVCSLLIMLGVITLPSPVSEGEDDKERTEVEKKDEE